ncbi:MAG: hypothetical protein IMW89_19480 [Ktedonobacteraceae bacterium]|nr:hypothetical protein [Ktedonobacteraceae bacterium]
MLKETRQRGREGYWYAYRRQGKRTFKQYAGRTSDLSIARLEQLAQALEARIGKRLPACKISPPAKDEPALALHSPSGETEGEACQQVVPTPFLPLPSRMPPLLTHKLRPPCLHAPLVVRAPLLALLETGLERKLTLLSAPAGFGKTTLSRDYAPLDRSQNYEPGCSFLLMKRLR